MSLFSLRFKIKDNYKYWARLNYIAESDDFYIAFKMATQEQREKLEKVIGTREAIFEYKMFLNSKKAEEFNAMQRLGVRKLRPIAKSLGIKNYFKMNKLTLLREIEHAENTRNKKTGNNITK